MSPPRRHLFEALLGLTKSGPEEVLDETALAPTFVPPPLSVGVRPAKAATRPIRPPGALAEADFLAACTQCQACIQACPEATLRLDSSGYPIADVLASACALCPHTPCIAACPTPALQATLPNQIRLGVAVVRLRLCLNADFLERAGPEDEPCFRCIDWCPVPEALAFRKEAPLPEVKPEHCTGCGLCVSACPAYPVALSIQARSL